MEAMTQSPGDSNEEALYCKKVRRFYEVRKIKLLQEGFWLVLLKLVFIAGVF